MTPITPSVPFATLDQKKNFHKNLADFLEFKELVHAEANRVSGSDSKSVDSTESEKTHGSTQLASSWRTQGFHFHRAHCWLKASACFYQAARILVDDGAFLDANLYFSWSFNMIQQLRLEIGQTNLKTISIDPISRLCYLVQSNALEEQHISDQDSDGKSVQSDISVGQSYGGRPEGGGGGSKVDSQDDSKEGKKIEEAALKVFELAARTLKVSKNANFLTRQSVLVYKVFQGDILSLETTIMMLIKFSQCLLLTSEDQTIVTAILQDALHLIMMSRKVTMKKMAAKMGEKFYHKSVLPPLLYARVASADAESARLKITTYSQKDFMFYLRDITVIFPILSTLSHQYQSGYFKDDERFSSLESLTQTFLAIANDHGDAIHTIKAYSLEVWRLNALQRHDEVGVMADSIRQLYNYKKHSAQLIATYGKDDALQSLVTGIMSRMYTGDFAIANESYDFCQRHISYMKHIHSIELTVLPLCVSLSIMKLFG